MSTKWTYRSSFVPYLFCTPLFLLFVQTSNSSCVHKAFQGSLLPFFFFFEFDTEFDARCWCLRSIAKSQMYKGTLSQKAQVLMWTAWKLQLPPTVHTRPFICSRKSFATFWLRLVSHKWLLKGYYSFQILRAGLCLLSFAFFHTCSLSEKRLLLASMGKWLIKLKDSIIIVTFFLFNERIIRDQRKLQFRGRSLFIWADSNKSHDIKAV